MARKPSSNLSNYRHPSCYANGDNGCSKALSKEHFISEVLLRRIQLNNTAKIAGFKWQAPETFNTVGIGSLASNILCARHNSALSHLDATIGKFVQAIHDVDQMVPGTPDQITLNGLDIALWMLKCIIGMSKSGNIASAIKPECIDVLFRRMPWPSGWGLYFLTGEPGPAYHTDSLLIETLVGPDKVVLATKFYVQGFPFCLCTGAPDNPQAFGVWRPRELLFRLERGDKLIRLNWKGACGGPVVLQRRGSYDGHPPTWQEWQRIG